MLFPSIAVALSVTLIFMFALRPFAHSVGLVDLPGGRKLHIGEVPIIGGIAMFIGSTIGLTLIIDSFPSTPYLFVAGGLLVLVGVLDDKYGLPASIRFVTQLTSVLIMVFGADVLLTDIGDPFGSGIIHLGPASLIVTALIALSVINAFNLVDGVDGLAGSMALIALCSISIITGYDSPSGMVALVLVSCISGFLIFNFPTVYNRKVRSFMGDAGSTFLGLIVVWLTVSACQGTEAVTSPVICLWFAAMPIYDLFTCFVKRTLNGHSPFRPGRDHFHHTLQRGGMGVRSVLVVLLGLQTIYAIIGLTGYFAGATDVVMFAAWSVLGVSQHWIVKKYAAMYRLDLRRKRAAGTPVTYP